MNLSNGRCKSSLSVVSNPHHHHHFSHHSRAMITRPENQVSSSFSCFFMVENDRRFCNGHCLFSKFNLAIFDVFNSPLLPWWPFNKIELQNILLVFHKTSLFLLLRTNYSIFVHIYDLAFWAQLLLNLSGIIDPQINVGGSVSNIEDGGDNNDDDEVKNQLPLLRPTAIRLSLPNEPENPLSSASTPVVTTADSVVPGRIPSW